MEEGNYKQGDWGILKGAEGGIDGQGLGGAVGKEMAGESHVSIQDVIPRSEPVLRDTCLYVKNAT